MARIRSIKPTIWTDERFIGLSRDARLLCIGMISHADDEGRLLATATRLAGDIFPADDLKPTQVLRWRSEIETAGMIRIYRIGTVEYAVFPRWKKHQRISKPQPSTLPSPERADAQARTDSTPKRGIPRDSERASRADPPTFRRQETGREGKTPPPQTPPTPQPPPPDEPSEERQGGEGPTTEELNTRALVDEVRSVRPEWSSNGIRKALDHPDVVERPWPVIAAAALAIARDPATTSPGRLVHDGPWWRSGAPRQAGGHPSERTVAEALAAAVPADQEDP